MIDERHQSRFAFVIGVSLAKVRSVPGWSLPVGPVGIDRTRRSRFSDQVMVAQDETGLSPERVDSLLSRRTHRSSPMSWVVLGARTGWTGCRGRRGQGNPRYDM